MEDKQLAQITHAIDRVAGKSPIIKVAGSTIGVTNTTYTSGYTLGSVFPIEVARGTNGTGIIQSVVVKDLSKQNIALDFVFFDSAPTTSAFSNNTEADIPDGDIDKVIGIVSIAAADYKSFKDNSVAVVSGIAMPFQCFGSSNLYCLLVTRGAPTYVANELSVAIGVLQDA